MLPLPLQTQNFTSQIMQGRILHKLINVIDKLKKESLTKDLKKMANVAMKGLHSLNDISNIFQNLAQI